MAVSVLASRIVRAALLDSAVYEEVEADEKATWQALLVVLLSGLAAGIGSETLRRFLIDSAVALAGWYLWAFVTYLVGTKVLPQAATKSDLGEMLRVTGFSASPGLLRVLGIVPILNNPVFLLTGIWMLVAMIVAIRQALDYTSTPRAIVVALIGWLIFFGVGVIAGGLLPPPV